MCILYQLSNAEMYGYEIMKIIKTVFPDVYDGSIYDGSIYAILRRLNTEGYTETFIKHSPSGPTRKYYRITMQGKEYLAQIISKWGAMVSGTQRLGNGVYHYGW
ncbi:PadR family transcriptional regulator [Moorella naiadis]|uniref:PadR family transcriptional regulator n=1 Tax=Moorella naiadis (nom. illeg.) TaxID=3093670 RepID=UPI003D9C9A67